MDHSKFDKRKTTKQCGISKGTDETVIATKLAERKFKQQREFFTTITHCFCVHHVRTLISSALICMLMHS